jgi:hypothetical protein
MVRIKVNKHSFELPAHEGEMTLDFYLMFINLDASNELNFISQLTGVSVEELNKTNNTKLDEVIYSTLSFLNEGFANHIDSLPVPTYLTVGNKRYKISSDLEFEKLGQKLEAKKLIVDNAEDINSIIPELISIYLDSKGSNREVLKKGVLQCLAIDVLPIARFFFLKFKGLVRNGTQLSEQGIQKKNQGQELRDLKSSEN